MRLPLIRLAACAAIVWLLALAGTHAQQAVFKGGVDIVNVTATVTDNDGRFISNLRKEDFVVSDDGVPQEIVSFSSERVPVSLGVLLDVSGSMTEDKMAAARAAINRFVFELLGDDDELFLAEFAVRALMLQTWTQDRGTFSRAMDRANQGRPAFGTAVFDAVAATLPAAATGVHTKKALLLISDGNDNRSNTAVKRVQDLIRGSEVLVYALGVDDSTGRGSGGVDTGTLRKLTDDTGGRTEVVRGFNNLDGATQRLAAELNQQYLIGYAAPPQRDGRWHEIKVEVRKRGAKVRARSGYVAS
jgi:Ca-activated chloride channel family protein